MFFANEQQMTPISSDDRHIPTKKLQEGKFSWKLLLQYSGPVSNETKAKGVS